MNARVDYYDENGRVVFSLPCDAERFEGPIGPAYRVAGEATILSRRPIETAEARLFVDGTFWEIDRKRVLVPGEVVSVDTVVPPPSVEAGSLMARIWSVVRSDVEEVQL